jgi:hypothetical protein
MSVRMITCTGWNGYVITVLFQGNNDQPFAQNPEDKNMHIQLMRLGEASVDDTHTAVNRWREYVDSYVTEHPTEWVQGLAVGAGHRQPRLFVRR